MPNTSSSSLQRSASPSMSRQPQQSQNPIFRFFWASPKSMRNFGLILLSCLCFDHYVFTHDSAYKFIDEEIYRGYIYPWASSTMFEPQLAVLSFMFACLVFTISEKFYFSKNKNSSSTVINGDLSTWLYWVVANVGLYIGLIEIFQRTVNYGGNVYQVNQHWRSSHYDDINDNVVLKTTAATNSSSSHDYYYSQQQIQNNKEYFIATRILFEVFLSVMGYDVIFALVHKSFHSTRSPKWWQKLHLTHHDNYQNADKPLHVMVTFHHHIVDAFIQIFINAVLQHIVATNSIFTPSNAMIGNGEIERHTISKALHNIIVTYLLVESHSGQDWAFMTHRWLFPEWFGQGAMGHQKHHRGGKAPYHQFFTIFDGEYY